MSPFEWIILVGLLLLSGFFSAVETALFSLNRFQQRRLAEKSPKLAARIEAMLQKPRQILVTILAGNVGANTALAGFTYILLSDVFDTPYRTMFYAIALSFVLIMVLGELIPKTLAVWNPPLVLSFGARPLAVAARWLQTPLIRLEELTDRVIRRIVPENWKTTSGLIGDEVDSLIEMSHEEGILDANERRMITEILRLNRKTVKEVMIPRTEIKAVSDTLAGEALTNELKRIKHERVPIFDESLDNIIGILNVKEFLFDPDQDIFNVLEMPSFVPGTMSALKLLQSFRAQKRRMAIVVDEFGGIQGLITIEDLMEEITGEIRDEFDPTDRWIEEVEPGRYRINGRMPLEELTEELGVNLYMEGVFTLGGYVFNQFGYLPSPGEKLERKDATITVLKLDNHHVSQLEVKPRAGRRK